MNAKPNMKDSGERRTFASGAVRDRGTFKPRPDLISPHANLREGAWLAVGAEKYGERNYERGMPISDCLASLVRHVEAYKLGLRDEDHMAAIRTNAGFILHFEDEIAAGRMNPALDDMPHYPEQSPIFEDQAVDYDDSIPTETATERIARENAGLPKCEKCKKSRLEFGSDLDGLCMHCRQQLPPSVVELQQRVHGGELLSDRENNILQRILHPERSSDSAWIECSKCHCVLVWSKDGGPPSDGLCWQCRRESDLPEPSTFYVAGPMRGIKDYNFSAFDEVAARARGRGWIIISPAEMDREHGIDPINDPGSVERANDADPNLTQVLAQRDCEVILGLKKDRGDGLILLPGWQTSTGARAEIALALWLGLSFRVSGTLNPIPTSAVRHELFFQKGGEET